MATITPPPSRARNLNEYNQRVRSPLARLRGYIRLYVGMEGVLLLVLLLALWFWVGLTLDFGVFKASGLDWVQESPWVMRLVLLILAAGAVLTLVSLLVFGRLMREFRDPALALVLERRFPKLLGDRLITAVELSNLRRAEEQGYSSAMILETIHEAAERVEQIPVQKAFNWGRLIRRAVLAVCLTVVLYLLAGGLFLALDSLYHVHAGRTGYSRFNETAAIWFERNILLQNTIWPRRAQLVFVTFQEPEKRIGQQMKIEPLRVRALQYVFADSRAPEGWRALTWNDLTKKEAQFADSEALAQSFGLSPRDGTAGLTLDELSLYLHKLDVRKQGASWQVADEKKPGEWRPLLWKDVKADDVGGVNPPQPPSAWKPKDAELGLTVDEVEAVIADHAEPAEQARDADVVLLKLGQRAELHAMFERLDIVAARPSMSRTLRKLDIPDKIHLKCTGDKTYMYNELSRTQDNEYVGTFGELKESVVFTVQAEDYYTPRRYITLVPPPSLVALGVQESRPAYLSYRPYDDATLAYLRGKKQPFEERDVLQAGSETSRIDVPAGTNLVLTARSDKPLKEAFLKPAKNVDELRLLVDEPAQGPHLVVVRADKAGVEIGRQPLVIEKDKKTFHVALPDVRKDLVVDFEFTDADDVKGKRKVVVKPQDDTAPELSDVRVEVIRKAALRVKDHDETYLWVTRKARIPLGGKVHDDNGLGDVRYRYTLNTSAKTDVNAIFLVPALALATPGGAGAFQSAAYLLAQDRDSQSYVPPLFTQSLRESRTLDIPIPPGGVDKLAAREKFLATEALGEFLKRPTIDQLLQQAQKPPFRKLLHDLEIKPDVAERVQTDPISCDFPLWTLKQLESLEDNHPFYRMDLWLEATDMDADEQLGPDGTPKPHMSKSKETFSFLIVPESVLLSKIGEDEVKQYASLNKRYQELQEKTGTMDAGIKGLDTVVQVKDLLAPSTRAEQVNELLENSLATTREVYAAYQRIVREEQLNVISNQKIDKNQNQIVAPLRHIIDVDFAAVLEANAKFRGALDNKAMSDKDRIDASRVAGKDLSAKTAQLMTDLNAVLEVMKGVVGIAELVQAATHIAEGVHSQEEIAKAIHAKLEDDFFGPEPPKKP